MTVRELVTVFGFEIRDEPLQKLDKEIDSTKAKSNNLAKAAKGIGTAYKVAAGIAAVAIGWISKNIIDATINIEGYRTQMEAFTGSTEAATRALAELRDKTADSLFGTGNLVNAYKQLRMVGMGADDTSRMIDILGDCANGSTENFNALSNVLTRVATTGKVNEGTLRQLANAGFGVADMAQGLGISTEQLNARIAAGKIGFDDLTKAMHGAASEGGRFFGNAEKQARTLGGALKILKSTISGFGDAIGMQVLPALVDMIRYITDLIKLGKTGLVDFGVNAFKYLINMIWQVIITFEILQMRMRKYGGAFTPLKEIFRDVFGFLKTVASSAYPFLLNLAQLFLVAFKPIQAFVRPVLESLKPIVQNVFGFFTRLLDGLIPKVNGLTPLFERIGQIVGKLVGPALAVAVAIKTVTAAFAIGKAAVAAYHTVVAIISNASKIWTAIQWELNAAMAANPVGLIILGVIALIAAIVLLVKNWDKVKEGFSKAGKAIGNFFSSAGKKIGEFAGSVKNKIGNAFESVKSKAQNAAIKMVKAFAERYPNLFRFIVDLMKVIHKTFMRIVEILKPPIQAFINVIKTGFSAAVNIIKTIAVSIFNIFKTVFVSVWNVIKTIFVSIWNVIKAVFDAVKNVVTSIVNVFRTVFMSVFNVVKTIFTTIFETIFSIFDGIIGIWKGGGNIFEKIWESIKLVFISVFNAMLKIARAIAEAFIAIWDSVKQVFIAVWQGAANVFSTIWKGIVNVFKAYIDGIKNIFGSIKDAFLNVLDALVSGVINFAGAVVELWRSLVDAVKEIWLAIIGFFSALWTGIINTAKEIWDGLKAWFSGFINGIKNIWNGIPGFFSGLWDGIVNNAKAIWDNLKAWFVGLVEGIKNLWSGFIGFFSGLWDAVKNGPREAIEYIKNAFFGLFDGIKEKFFGFVNVIKNGWDTVKGFFGGVADKVVNLVTGGDRNNAETPQRVNDMILTPDGGYSTHPKDTLIAMQNPGDLFESLFKFLSGGLQLQPAMAGAPAASLMGKVMNNAAAQNTFNSSRTTNETKISAPINVSVNASGMSPEAAAAAVRRGVEAALSDAIDGARGTIPYGEAKRNL